MRNEKLGRRILILCLIDRKSCLCLSLYDVPGAEVIKLFSCSTQLSMKFKMLINIEIAKIDGIFRFNSLEPAIYPANKC